MSYPRIRVRAVINANEVNAPDARHTDCINAVAAGRWAGRPIFASAGDDRRVLLWDAATGEPVGPALGEFPARVSHVVFAGSDRDVLVTGDTDGGVLRWEIRDGAPHADTFQHMRSQIIGLAAAVVDGRAVIGIGTTDGALRVFDAATREKLAELRIGEGKALHLTDIGVLDGRLVALTVAHNVAEPRPYLPEVTVWDVATGAPLREPWLVPEEAEFFGSLASLDGELVAIRGTECSGWMGRDEEEEEEEDEDQDEGYDSPYQSEYFLDQVHDVELGIVATGGTRYVMEQLPDQPGVATVAPTPHGDVVLFTIGDKIAVVNMRHPAEPGDIDEFFYTGHDARVFGMAATEVDGRTVIASGDTKGNLRFWGLDTPDQRATLK